MCRKPVGEGAKRVTTGRSGDRAPSTADSLPLAIPERFLSNKSMAMRQPTVPLGEEPGDAALQQSPWRKSARLSSVADAGEDLLARAGFDRGPWLAVAFAGGIAAWFVLARPVEWVLAASVCLMAALGAVALWRGNPARQHVMTACVGLGLLVAAGIGVVWARSALIGAPAIERPVVARLDGRVLERIEQPAEDRVRLVLAARDPASGRAIKVRVNVPLEQDRRDLAEGALVRLQARLMPPSPPMLPGGY